MNLYNAIIKKKYQERLEYISRYSNGIQTTTYDTSGWLASDRYKTKFGDIIVGLWKGSTPEIRINTLNGLIIKDIGYSDIFESEEGYHLLDKKIKDVIAERESQQVEKGMSEIEADIRDITNAYGRIFTRLLNLDIQIDDEDSVMIRTEAASMLSTAVNHILTGKGNTSNPFSNFISRISGKKN